MASAPPEDAAGTGSLLRLQVEDHEQPLVELRRLVNVHRGYELMDAAFTRMQAGNVDGLVPALERALEVAPTSDEIRFRLAVSRTMFGDPRGRATLDEMYAANPGWRELIPRLAAAGAIPATPEMIELLIAGG